jgi:hypothetical protein
MGTSERFFRRRSYGRLTEREKTGFELFVPGFQNWKKDIITSPGLYGLESDTIDALKWYSDDDDSSSAGTERKNIFNSRQQIRELSARYQLAHI